MSVEREMERISRIDRVVRRYAEQANQTEEDDQTNLRDILADLMHWAGSKGLDFNNELCVGWNNYLDEVAPLLEPAIPQVVITVRGGVAEVQSADGAEVTIIDHDNGDDLQEWFFLAINTLGAYESFVGYHSQAEAAAAIERLRVAGYTNFSAPEQETNE